MPIHFGTQGPGARIPCRPGPGNSFSPPDQTLYRTRPFTDFWVVTIEHLRRVWHADRGRLLLRTPGPVPLGLAYVLLVETNPFPILSLFYRTMLFEYPSALSLFCPLAAPQPSHPSCLLSPYIRFVSMSHLIFGLWSLNLLRGGKLIFVASGC